MKVIVYEPSIGLRVTPTFGFLLASVPIVDSSASADWTLQYFVTWSDSSAQFGSPVAGASQAIGEVYWPPNASWKVPPVTFVRKTCWTWPVPSSSVTLMWPTTSLGWNCASVIALTFTFEVSLPPPPLKNMSS